MSYYENRKDYVLFVKDQQKISLGNSPSTTTTRLEKFVVCFVLIVITVWLVGTLTQIYYSVW